MSMKLKYLERQKSGVYRYRREVPKDIQDSVGVKTFKRSLDTKDEDLAIERWKTADTMVKDLFQRCKAARRRKAPLSDKAISAIASNHGAEILSRDQKVRVGGYSKLPPMERFPFWESETYEYWGEGGIAPVTPEHAVLSQQGMYELIIPDLKEALSLDSYDDLPDEVEERILARLKKEGFKGKPSPEVFRPFVEAELKAMEGILSRCEGESVPTPVLVPVNKHLLSIEAEIFADKKVRKKDWQEKTARMFLAAVKLFIEVRADKDIAEYKKDDARIFQDVLLEYPANAWKYPELKGLTPEQIIKVGKPPMSPNNARKIFAFVGSFFRDALKGYDSMESNPFEGQGIKKKDNEDSRKPFTVVELNKVFDAPLYHGVKSPRFWSMEGDVSMRYTAKFWIPLIGLFTGMRLGEIAQLRKADIRQEEGFLIFDLCRGDDKTFKTKAAIRQIPVHHLLVRCGLKKHRDQCKGQRLFPDLSRSKADGSYSFAFSKYFNAQFLVSVGIKRPALVFHSFRHLYEEAAMRTGMQDSMVDALQGHKLDKMKAVYVDKLDLRMRNEFVQKIEYKGLDLSHLYV